jgi:hypothetical protein
MGVFRRSGMGGYLMCKRSKYNLSVRWTRLRGVGDRRREQTFSAFFTYILWLPRGAVYTAAQLAPLPCS